MFSRMTKSSQAVLGKLMALVPMFGSPECSRFHSRIASFQCDSYGTLFFSEILRMPLSEKWGGIGILCVIG